MQAGTFKEEEKKLDKREKLKLARAKLIRDRDFIEKCEMEAEERLDLVKIAVPGAKGSSELVLGGPNANRYKAAMQQGRIGLWRNVKKGADLVWRKERWEEKREGGV